MNVEKRKLRDAPIVEAVVDVDCDVWPSFDLVALEGDARNRLIDRYPNFRRVFSQELKLEANAEAPLRVSSRQAVQALRFLSEDNKQLVQIRKNGFSFNRLEPYSTFDDYIREIERTWR